jgi:proton-coupled amino acid transporter
LQIDLFLKILFQIIKICFAIAIFISYNLQFYVAAEIIWSAILRSSNYLRTQRLGLSSSTQTKLYMLYENLFRIVLVVFTFSLAVNVPRIDLFISLVGAIASSTLAIIIPPILDIIVFYEASNRSKVKLVKNILIIIFGFYIFIAGTWVSVNDIIEYLRHR